MKFVPDRNGGYTKWSEWSDCSATCGGEIRWHTRSCTNPPPKNEGKTCIEQNLGPENETGLCNTEDCRKWFLIKDGAVSS